MLSIEIPSNELWDGQHFIYTKTQVLSLEHSLVSISKWESKWHKPFFTREDKTLEESIDYVRCMTITQNVDPMVYYGITEEQFQQIGEYINEPMTATWFRKEEGRGAGVTKPVTSELIYYWMTVFHIPMECQKWHLNRLITLIRVCEEENKPPKKMSKQELLRRNAAINAERKRRLNTRG